MHRLLACLVVVSAPLVIMTAARAAPPRAYPSPAALCETAIESAARAERLPSGLLLALADLESGRPAADGRVRPWPWTIDVAGEGRFFSTKAEAVAAVRALMVSGVRSIDVGCLQVNLMHHPTAFASLDAAFDPRSNTQYGARFLVALYGRDRDWGHAVAAYHSETPGIGAAYRRRVMAVWRPESVGPATPLAEASRRAAYADFLPEKQRYAAFGNCRCTGEPGVRQVCRCD